MAVEFPEHPFWDFSLEVYMTEGVAPACLVLQERHQIDVNILMYCLWVGASGRGALSAGEMAAVMEAVRDWHATVVRGLRAVRARMKGGMPPAPRDLSDSLRGRIAKIEIDCEHVEQLMLAAALDRNADPDVEAKRRAADAIANIGLFFDAHGARADSRDRDALADVLGPAFRNVKRHQLLELCANLTSS